MASATNQRSTHASQRDSGLARQVRAAVLWRSGGQIAAQIVQWGATFLVIRILSPSDYGLFAMTGVVMALMGMLDGYGLANGLIRQSHVTPRMIRQLLGMLIVVNVALAAIQVAIAPLAAAYYRQPEVAALLRVQALMYLTTPFIALPAAMLARAMDFRAQAKANMLAAVAGAVTALAGALAGWGVWTLVAAPFMLFLVRAIAMTWQARAFVLPSFDFRGAGHLARYGGVMALGQLFWFVQSQADVFIAGRHFSAHLLGIYTTSLFLAQIVVAKFVPALNDVAFSAYARLQHHADARAQAFVKGVRVVMAAALPFYLGLAATAEPLVLAMLGEKWREAIPVVRVLALAMPFMTMQVLYQPACDAIGRPGISVRNGATGAAIMAAAFAVGVGGGATGLAMAWCVGAPLYLLLGSRRALPAIGARGVDVFRAVRPAATAALAMAAIVIAIDRSLPPLAAVPRLAVLVVVGVAAYAAALLILARSLVRELAALARR
ncbi:MAG: lipopolysaccharide biosynthesis protein [Sphingomonas adhaesiva]|uniref:lipopolysaccharide biosynthesis protein n=1 Tax=Sphingomonas adhaesiva TaxID=28212 RepID=UPI002FFC50CA